MQGDLLSVLTQPGVPAARELPTEPARDPLRLTFLKSVAWTGAARWTAQLASWSSTLVVARLLSPDDYGLFGMTSILIGLLTLVTEFGLGTTVVTLRALTPRQLAQLHGLAALLGTLGCLTCVALAPVLAAFFSRPAIAPLTVAMAGALVMAALRTVPAALLQREFRFRVVAAIDSLQAGCAAAAMLALAWVGGGAWSLVGSALIGGAVATAVTLIVCRCPLAWPRRSELREPLAFTRHQLAGAVAWYVYTSADFVVAGKLLGARDLGVYTMAWTIARIVPERLAWIVVRVTPSFLAAVGTDAAALRKWVYALTEAISVVTFPLLAGLVMVAPVMVPLILGPQWAPAVVPMQLLAVYGIIDPLAQLLNRALTAVGDVRFTARLAVALAVLLPIGFVIGARYGPAGIAFAWLVLAPIVRAAMLLRARWLFGLALTNYAAALWPAVSATAAMLVGISVVRMFLAAEMSPWSRLFGEITTGAACYLLALVTLHSRRLMAWRQQWRRRMQPA